MGWVQVAAVVEIDDNVPSQACLVGQSSRPIPSSSRVLHEGCSLHAALEEAGDGQADDEAAVLQFADAAVPAALRLDQGSDLRRAPVAAILRPRQQRLVAVMVEREAFLVEYGDYVAIPGPAWRLVTQCCGSWKMVKCSMSLRCVIPTFLFWDWRNRLSRSMFLMFR